jgi:DNA-binding NarL/FixJ family response regulator
MSNAPVILLIDDNQDDREFYSQRLAIIYPECDVVQTATGQEGLSYCNRQTVDCVVLEIALPDISGLEVLVKLVPRTWNPDMPVVVLTRIADRFLWEAALKNGAQAALYKPMTSGDMLDKAILNAMARIPREGNRALATKEDSREQTDCPESAISCAVEWANLGGG